MIVQIITMDHFENKDGCKKLIKYKGY